MLKHIKELKKNLSNFKTKKSKIEYIENIKNKKKKLHYFTYLNFYEKHKIKIIYQNIDYLTIKIEKNENLYKKLNSLPQYNHQEIKQNNINIKNIFHYKMLNYYIINLWIIFNWQKHIYWIYDSDNNKIWSITYIDENIKKNNHNVINTIELTWLFFKCYKNDLDNIFNFLNIDKKENNIIKRLDYCVDFLWIEVFQLLEYLKSIHKKTDLKKSKNVIWLTATDLKQNEVKFNSDLRYWNQETYKNFLWTLNDLKIYDKILDLLQPDLLKRKVKWENPYYKYINSNLPITRIELKKKSASFTKMNNNSYEYLSENIEVLFFDYLLKFFDIDLSILIWDSVSLNWKKTNFLAKEKKDKSILRCIQMIKANIKTLENITWKEHVIKILDSIYPWDINTLPYLDQFESYELITDIFN